LPPTLLEIGVKKLRRLVKAIDSINISVGKVTSFTLIPLAIIIGYEVIMRGFFNLPTRWAHETGGMLFGAAFLLGAGYTLCLREHARVDIFMSRLRPRIQAAIDIITHLLLWLYAGVIVWVGWEYAVRALVRMETTQSGWAPLTFPIKFIIVLGAFLFLLQLLAKYIRDFYMLSRGNELK